MTDKEDVFDHFDRLKNKKQTIDDRNKALAAEAQRERDLEHQSQSALNEKHHNILNDVVLARIEEIREKLKNDVVIQTTPHVAEKPLVYGTSVTVSFKEITDDEYSGRKTLLYYIKIKPDGSVAVERNNLSKNYDDLTKQIGKVTADQLNAEYIDKVIKIITSEWFDAVRLGL